MPDSDQVTIAAVFANESNAGRGRQSLVELDIPDSSITLVRTSEDDELERQSALTARFSDAQIEHFRGELAQGHLLLLVESPEPVDRAVTRLGISGALQVEIGEFIEVDQSRHTMPIREEQISVDKSSRVAGEAVIRKSVEEIPVETRVDIAHEELDVERVSVDEVVDSRQSPWQEGDVLVVPVYEERLRVVREWVMREQLRIKLHQVSERHTVADTVRREQVEIEDPDRTGRVNVHDRGTDSDVNSRSSTSE